MNTKSITFPNARDSRYAGGIIATWATHYLEFHGELDEMQRQRLLEIDGRCPVHRTLTGEVRIETTLRPE